jgi:hypothetical protein
VISAELNIFVDNFRFDCLHFFVFFSSFFLRLRLYFALFSSAILFSVSISLFLSRLASIFFISCFLSLSSSVSWSFKTQRRASLDSLLTDRSHKHWYNYYSRHQSHTHTHTHTHTLTYLYTYNLVCQLKSRASTGKTKALDIFHAYPLHCSLVNNIQKIWIDSNDAPLFSSHDGKI